MEGKERTRVCVSDVNLSQESRRFPTLTQVRCYSDDQGQGSLLLGAGWDKGQRRAA